LSTFIGQAKLLLEFHYNGTNGPKSVTSARNDSHFLDGPCRTEQGRDPFSVVADW